MVNLVTTERKENVVAGTVVDASLFSPNFNSGASLNWISECAGLTHFGKSIHPVDGAFVFVHRARLKLIRVIPHGTPAA